MVKYLPNLLPSVKAKTLVAMQGGAFLNFYRAIPSPHTKKLYSICLRKFIEFLHEKGHIAEPVIESLLVYKTRKDGEREIDVETIENWIISYVAYQREQKLSVSIIRTRNAAIKLFYEMNRVRNIPWKIIGKTLGENVKRKDRAYTREEIARLLDKTDVRGKALILLLASSGMRIGAIPTLRYGHFERIEKYGLYQITVYESTTSEYTTFCTPEAARALDDYLEFRRRYGEKITDKSPIIREQFDRADALKDFGKAPAAKALGEYGLTTIVRGVLISSGLREIKSIEGMDKTRIRHSVKQSHGLRKFYDTTATKAGMHPLFIEMTMGHGIALKGSYFKPTLQDMLEGNDRMHGYIAAINELTIDETKRQERKIEKLEHENDYFKGIIPGIVKAMEKNNIKIEF